MARPCGTQRVHTGLPGPVHTDHVARWTSAWKRWAGMTGRGRKEDEGKRVDFKKRKKRGDEKRRTKDS